MWNRDNRKSEVCLTDDFPNRNLIIMLHYAIIFLIVAIIAAVLGFGGIAGTAAWIAKLLFIVFLILAIISFLTGRRPRV